MDNHVNPIGTYKGEGENKERIGIPLWVHRRCKEPMFSIANEIAYENKMVLAINKTGDGHWFNVDGKVQRAQYVKEHGELDRKSTRLNSSHVAISYAVFCLKK